MKTTVTLAIAALAAIGCPAAASAADVTFAVTGDYTASWTIPDGTLPDESSNQGLAYYSIAGKFPGSTAGSAYLDFYSQSNGGGMMISDADSPAILATLYGLQLYDEPAAAPVWKTGTFKMVGNNGTGSYTLTIAQATAVPEAATWMLMIAGVGMIGGALRQRRARGVAVRYA